MDKVQATQAIKQRFLDQQIAIGGTFAAVPIVFDNEPAPDAPTYLRMNVIETTSEQWTMGDSAIFRRWGQIKIKVITPTGTGTTKTDTSEDYLVKKLRKIYESKRFGSTGPGDSGIICYSAPHRPLGVDGEKWTSIVEVTFRYDETRASIDA